MMTTANDIRGRAIGRALDHHAAVSHDPHQPEGISVSVLTTDEAIAGALAPGIAARLWPGHRYGRVQHSEPIELPDGRAAIEVVLEVIR